MATADQIYVNKDGLRRKFEEARIEPIMGGQYGDGAESVTIEVEIDAKKLKTTDEVLFDVINIPRNHVIQEIQIVTEVALVGGTTVTVGSKDFEGTVISNAFLKAVPVADLATVGKLTRVTAGGPLAGAKVGPVSDRPVYITANGAGTFTAGHIAVRFHCFVPRKDQNPGKF